MIPHQKPITVIRKTLSLLVLSCVLPFCTSTHERPGAPPNHISLIMPVDHLVTVNPLQSFSWRPVTGAIYYEPELVTPDFGVGARTILDTTLTENAYNGHLAPGRYRWCVKAFDAASVAYYSDTSLLTVH